MHFIYFACILAIDHTLATDSHLPDGMHPPDRVAGEAVGSTVANAISSIAQFTDIQRNVDGAVQNTQRQFQHIYQDVLDNFDPKTFFTKLKSLSPLSRGMAFIKAINEGHLRALLEEPEFSVSFRAWGKSLKSRVFILSWKTEESITLMNNFLQRHGSNSDRALYYRTTMEIISIGLDRGKGIYLFSSPSISSTFPTWPLSLKLKAIHLSLHDEVELRLITNAILTFGDPEDHWRLISHVIDKASSLKTFLETPLGNESFKKWDPIRKAAAFENSVQDESKETFLLMVNTLDVHSVDDFEILQRIYFTIFSQQNYEPFLKELLQDSEEMPPQLQIIFFYNGLENSDFGLLESSMNKLMSLGTMEVMGHLVEGDYVDLLNRSKIDVRSFTIFGGILLAIATGNTEVINFLFSKVDIGAYNNFLLNYAVIIGNDIAVRMLLEQKEILDSGLDDAIQYAINAWNSELYILLRTANARLSPDNSELPAEAA